MLNKIYYYFLQSDIYKYHIQLIFEVCFKIKLKFGYFPECDSKLNCICSLTMKCHERTSVRGKTVDIKKIKQRSGSVDSAVKQYDKKYILSTLEDAAGTGEKSVSFKSDKMQCSETCQSLDSKKTICQDKTSSCSEDSKCDSDQSCICTITVQCKAVKKKQEKIEATKDTKDLSNVDPKDEKELKVFEFGSGGFQISKVAEYLGSQKSSEKEVVFKSTKDVCQNSC